MPQLETAAYQPTEVDPRLAQLAAFWSERLDRLERRYETRRPLVRRLADALAALVVRVNDFGEPSQPVALQHRNQQLQTAEREYGEVIARFILHSG
jgi:hypothetical protein